MKTLYVSDLDGTLLNTSKHITPETARMLNACIDRGMRFAVATARMAYGCDYRLSEIHMDTPGILTNGVFLYNFTTKRYLSAEAMQPDAAAAVVEAFARCGCSCFVYTFANDQLNIYFDDPALKEQTQYYSKRALESCGEIRVVDRYAPVMDGADVVYITLTGPAEQLAPVRDAVAKIPGVACAYYLNIYNGAYCIEVFSDRASKRNALQKLQTMLGCDELVVFGDNLNDLSMIEIANRSYAPANALDEVKQRVTAVLDDCDHDGVAKFLAKEFQL